MWPIVTVQLPMYNERYVAERIIEAVAALDYPRDRLQIQVIDDSTDETLDLVAETVERLQVEGVWIDLIHRDNRTGYKAGALAHAMPQAKGEFIAIFDADFVPKPDFLRRTIPHFFREDRIGVVQTRWGHQNAADSLLTRSQALAIDNHFAVEQFARSASKLLFSFNGSGGIWRRTCIEDAGGWHADTLTEDFDLSYRAQMKGWRFVFIRDVVVPGEVPPQMSAYKNQQARWAKGSTQVLIKLAVPLLRSNLSYRQRYMGLIQLFQYAIQPVILTTLVITPLMILTDSLVDLSIAPLGIIGLGAPLLFVLGQQALYRDWPRRILYFPFLTLFSSGMAANNSRAALSAFLRTHTEFVRTPKYNRDNSRKNWKHSQYARLVSSKMLLELGFAAYTLLATLLAADRAPSFIPYFALYTVAFLTVVGWEIAENLGIERRRTRSTHSASMARPRPSVEAEPMVRHIGR